MRRPFHLFTSKLLKISLSVSLALPYSALAQKTQNGGGGALPPSYPPTTYSNGSGPQPDQSRPLGKSSFKFSGFGYHEQLPTKTTRPVFTEGALNQQGQEKVFRYIEGDSSKVQSGVIESKNTKILSSHSVATEYKIKWGKEVSIQSLGTQEKKPNLKMPSFIWDGKSSYTGGSFVAFEAKGNGTYYPVYAEGRQVNGKDRIFRLNTSNKAYVLGGVLIKDPSTTKGYKIVWDKEYTPKTQLISPKARKETTRVGQKTEAHSFTSKLKEKPLLLEHKPQKESSKSTFSGSGQSHISSNYKEYLPEFDKRLKPSKLKSTLGWSAEHYQEMKNKVKRLRQGDLGLSNQLSKEKVKNVAKESGKGALRVGGGVLAFYAALGVLSAIKLSTDYGSDPRAWNSFTEILTDPMGYLVFAGFIAGSSSVYLAQRATGKLGWTSKTPGAGTFILGLVVGAIAATAMSEILYHPSFDKCTGFDNYDKKGSFRWNLEECDKLANSFSTRKLADDVLPTVVSLSLAGGLFYGGAKVAMYMAQRQALSKALQQMSFYVMRFPKAGPLVTAGSWVLGGIFIIGAHTLVADTLGLEKWIKDHQITELSFQKNRYGQTLSENYEKLMDSWHLLTNNPQLEGDIPEECFAEQSSARNALQPLSSKCNALGPRAYTELEGRLSRFAEIQRAWRTNQFQPVLSAYTSYLKKVNTYYTQVDTAHRFYFQVVRALKNEKFKKASALDQNFLNNLQEQLEQNLKLSQWENKDAFLFLSTPTAQDHLLASMICGPKSENTGEVKQDSLLGGIKDWFLDFNSATPREVVKHSRFSDLGFNPPRITLSEGSSLCSKPGASGDKTKLEDYTAAIDGRNHQGAIEILKASIDPLLLQSESMDDFQKWWTVNVTANTRLMEKEFRKMYLELLEKKYFPALNSDEVHRSYGLRMPRGLTRFRQSQLKLSSEESQQSNNTLKVPYGLVKSLEEEMKTYLSLLADLEGVVSGSEQLNPEIMKLSKEILRVHRDVYKAVNHSQGLNIEKIKALGAQYSELQEQLGAHLDVAFYSSTQPQSLISQVFLRNLLLEQLNKCFTEVQTHIDLVTHFQQLSTTRELK